MSPGPADPLASIAWAALATGIRLREELAGACLGDIVAAARLIAASLARGGKVILFGNGGSAAGAQHISAELVGRYADERPALSAIALTVDSSALTANANDYGFEQVFARQLEALACAGDIAVAISTSGRSPNVLAGAAVARARGAMVIGLTGAGGGPLRAASDLCIAVPSRVAARVQECHITIGHVWCELIEAIDRPQDGALRSALSGKIVDPDDLAGIAVHLRRGGRTIVWTNGCFDILHAGHLASLRQARALGDWLVVGLNSDASVRRLKGPERPIFSAAWRAEVLAALAVVDLVTVFGGDTPEECISHLRPDVCCKGADYDPEQGGRPVPERHVVDGYGGRMVYLPLVPGLSTTTAAALARRAPHP